MATPLFRVVMKNKQAKEFVNVAVIFDKTGDKPAAMLLEKPFKDKPGVDKIEVTMSDGTVISSTDYYINLYDGER